MHAKTVIIGWALAACGSHGDAVGAGGSSDAAVDAPAPEGAHCVEPCVDCAPVALADVPFTMGDASVCCPSAMAVDEKNLYWTTSSGRGADEPDGTVWRVDKCGGIPHQIAARQALAWGIVATPLGLFWTTRGTTRGTNVNGVYLHDGALNRWDDRGMTGSLTGLDGPSEMAFETSVLYWVSRAGIQSMGFISGVVTEVAAVDEPWGVAVDNLWIYWTSGAGTLERARKNDRAPSEVIARGGADWRGLAVDESTVFFLEFGSLPPGGPIGPAIYSVPKEGGTPTRLKGLAQGSNALRIDERSVYFVDGALLKMAKDGKDVRRISSIANDSFAIDDLFVYFIDQNRFQKTRKQTHDAAQ